MTHLFAPDRLAGSPRRELVDLERQRELVVSDELHELVAHGPLDLDAALRELLGDPLVELALRDFPLEHGARLRARLGERRVALRRVRDEAEDGAGRGRAEVLDDRVDVGLLPPAREPTAVVGPAVDLGDEDEPAVAEQRARVARGDDVLAGRAVLARGREALDGARLEVPAEPFEGPVDLGPVRAGDEVDGLEFGHRRSGYRCARTARVRPSDSTTMRPFSSVRSVWSPGKTRSAASVSGRGCP